MVIDIYCYYDGNWQKEHGKHLCVVILSVLDQKYMYVYVCACVHACEHVHVCMHVYYMINTLNSSTVLCLHGEWLSIQCPVLIQCMLLCLYLPACGTHQRNHICFCILIKNSQDNDYITQCVIRKLGPHRWNLTMFDVDPRCRCPVVQYGHSWVSNQLTISLTLVNCTLTAVSQRHIQLYAEHVSTTGTFTGVPWK